jgi:hypothetical protein
LFNSGRPQALGFLISERFDYSTSHRSDGVSACSSALGPAQSGLTIWLALRFAMLCPCRRVVLVRLAGLFGLFVPIGHVIALG